MVVRYIIIVSFIPNSVFYVVFFKYRVFFLKKKKHLLFCQCNSNLPRNQCSYLVSVQGDIHFDRQNKGNVHLPFVRSNFNRFDNSLFECYGVCRQQLVSSIVVSFRLGVGANAYCMLGLTRLCDCCVTDSHCCTGNISVT